MSVFAGPLTALTKESIDKIITDRRHEDVDLEFKRELPSNTEDRWYRNQQDIGDRAKIEILAEVIAFANTSGGTLILGVEESKEKPARATKVFLQPKCHELADRFRNICRDLIEPHLANVEIEGVATEEDGGVVIFRVGASMVAPHRHSRTKEAYSRHRDRTEAMSMREIQDLTLRTVRGLAAVDSAFELARLSFHEFCARESPNSFLPIGLSVAAFPVAQVRLGRLSPKGSLLPSFDRVQASFGTSNRMGLDMPIPRSTWRPMIGGIWIQGGNDNFILRAELRDDGLIHYMLRLPSGGARQKFWPSVFMAMISNVLKTTGAVRAAAGTNSEYACQAYLNTPVGLDLTGYGSYDTGRTFGEIPVGEHLLPRYITYGREDWPQIGRELETDLWAAAHVEPLGDSIDLHFD